MGKHLCQSLFVGFQPETLLKEAPAQLFTYQFCEIFKNILFIEHLLATAFICSYLLNVIC